MKRADRKNADLAGRGIRTLGVIVLVGTFIVGVALLSTYVVLFLADSHVDEAYQVAGIFLIPVGMVAWALLSSWRGRRRLIARRTPMPDARFAEAAGAEKEDHALCAAVRAAIAAGLDALPTEYLYPTDDISQLESKLCSVDFDHCAGKWELEDRLGIEVSEALSERIWSATRHCETVAQVVLHTIAVLREEWGQSLSKGA